MEIRSDYDARVNSHGAFIHDDWRVNDRLTPISASATSRARTQRGGEQERRRFDLTTPNPIEAQARANFAANPPAGVPISASAFAVVGGYTYLGDDVKNAWNADRNTFQPRLVSPTS